MLRLLYVLPALLLAELAVAQTPCSSSSSSSSGAEDDGCSSSSSSSATTSTTPNATSTSTTTTTPTANSTTTPDSNATTTQPTETTEQVVTASFIAAFNLPPTVTSSDLMASPTFKSVMRDGICAGLAISDCTDVIITGFDLSRRRELAAHRRLNGTNSTSKNVKTNFKVKVASAALATTMKNTLTATATATTLGSSITTQLTSNVAALISEIPGVDNSITTAVTVDTTSMTAAEVAVTVLVSGTATLEYYTDAACTTAKSAWATSTGAIGASSCIENIGGSKYHKVASCGSEAMMGQGTVSTCAGQTMTATSTGVCHAYPGATGTYFKITCSAAAAASTSAGVVRNPFVGTAVAMAGLVALGL